MGASGGAWVVTTAPEGAVAAPGAGTVPGGGWGAGTYTTRCSTQPVASAASATQAKAANRVVIDISFHFMLGKTDGAEIVFNSGPGARST